ncbi:MAG: hypothetical protein EOO90_22120 [Pedobacter sp.]|nr:MAG: hypothetical protein EOO90_22120 [Pedobacter sp.]
MFTQYAFYHFVLRLLVALLASHFIVLHSASETWLQLLSKTYYYVSVFYSMIIAFVLIEFVHQISRYLNKSLNGFQFNALRLRHQFLKGFILTGILAFLLAALLFLLNGENIFNTGYLSKLYVYILLFIFCINVLYLLYFYHVDGPKTRYQVINPDQLEMAYARSQLANKNVPALIYHDNKTSFSINFDGVKTIWPHTIDESSRLLDEEDYFQINRKAIVHRAAILTFSPGNLELTLIFSSPVELTIARRRASPFKHWLANPKGVGLF